MQWCWHAVITIAEVLTGLVLGTILGMATALQLMMSPTASRVMMPIMVFSQSVPVFALAPVLTLWLGYGMASKIAMALLISPAFKAFCHIGKISEAVGSQQFTSGMRASPNAAHDNDRGILISKSANRGFEFSVALIIVICPGNQ